MKWLPLAPQAYKITIFLLTFEDRPFLDGSGLFFVWLSEVVRFGKLSQFLYLVANELIILNVKLRLPEGLCLFP